MRLIYAALLLFSACQPAGDPGRIRPAGTGHAGPDSADNRKQAGCDLDKLLQDPKLPAAAKSLVEGKGRNTAETLTWFSKIRQADQAENAFYFKAITRAYQLADGAVAEGLGYEAKKYIENNTQVFLTFFDNRECFNREDLKSWVSMVMLEFNLQAENDADASAVDKYIEQLNKNCRTCSAGQRQTLHTFTAALAAAP